MNKFSFRILFPILLVLPFSSFAEAPKMIFEENKNQWPEQVKFQADIPGGKLFLEKNTFTYLYQKHGGLHRPTGPVKIQYHAIKVNFENSNPNVKVSGNNLFPDHVNYYKGNDPSKWAENVRLYGQVYYQDLYEKIDMRVYNVESNLKYDLIVYPGADIKNIKLNYNGQDEMHLENGNLFIKTSVYDLIEQKPYAYQEINGVKTQVACSYVLKKNTITFELGNYNPDLPLIIDPTLVAATYTGAGADNWGFTATYDAAGNIYAGGVVLSGGGFPTTPGAWDQSWNGGQTGPGQIEPFDVAIIKYNPTGSQRLFGTYYGGSANEQPHSMVVNNNNELYVVGRTNSSSATFPTLGAYDATANGGFDIFVAKFNTAGNLLASTFVGGASDDGVNCGANGPTPSTDWTNYSSNLKFNFSDDGRSEIILDGSSNVYVASCTRSAAPPLVNPYDNTLGGVQDGYVFKMNSTLNTMVWSTFLGGTISNVGINAANQGNDAAYGLKLDGSGNVYVTGGTTSIDFLPVANPPVLHSSYRGGSADGFIAVFNSAGVLQRATYLGTSEYDQSYLIEIDAIGDLYVFGQTRGSGASAYPVTPGTYSVANSGQFIHKVKGNLSTTVFSTTFGNGSSGGFARVNLSPIAFLVDSCQRIYISGWGRGLSADYRHPFAPTSATNTLTVTSNAYQTTTDGCDFYYMVLNYDAKALEYATYFGENANAAGQGDHVDGGTSRFDSRGVIYQASCASCLGTQNFPTTPGAWSSVNGSSNCNEAVVKMDFSVKPLAVPHIVGASTGCAPFTVSFNNAGSSGEGWLWDFGDGDTSSFPSPSHVYNSAGSYTVTLYAFDSVGVCNFEHYDTLIVPVGAVPSITTAQINILCPGTVGSATVTANGGMPPLTYQWDNLANTNTPIITNLSSGSHTVTITDALGCDTTVFIAITEIPPLQLNTSSSGATCATPNGGASVTVSGGTPGYTYAWNDTSGAIVGSNATANNLLAGSYTITVTDVNGCIKTTPVTVNETNGPIVNTAVMSHVLCNGDSSGSAAAGLSSGTAPYTYQWSANAGSQTTPIASNLPAGTYTVIIWDSKGCSADTTVTITEPPTSISASTSSTPLMCFGDSSGTAIALGSGGTPGYAYQWSTSPVQLTSTATGLSAGISYSVTVTDANGCTFVQAITPLTQPLALTSTMTTSGVACGPYHNAVATATGQGGTGPYTYQWFLGPATPSYPNLGGGTYIVTITDAHNCTTTDTAVIVPSVQPIADFSYNPTISCEGVFVQFTDESSLATSWNWNFGDGTGSTLQHPGHMFPYNGTFNVTLTAANPPCDSTITKAVTIGDMFAYVTIGAANVFSPNNDGLNDCFLPALIGPGADTLRECIALEVFDRWGIKMFESKITGTGANNCWNGNNRQDSKPANDGTYYYIATLGETTIKGYVTLVRHK